MAPYKINRCQSSRCLRRCPHINCNCPEASWCAECTRFWCEDCWGTDGTHHHLDEVLLEHTTTTQVPVPPTSSSTPSHAGNQALQDLQLDLMLLEQQNKRRLMMARMEQDAVARNTQLADQKATSQQAPISAPSTSTPPNRAEEIMRLMMIEQQNKRQLWADRREQLKAAAPQAPPYGYDMRQYIDEGRRERPQPAFPMMAKPLGDATLQDMDEYLKAYEEYKAKQAAAQPASDTSNQGLPPTRDIHQESFYHMNVLQLRDQLQRRARKEQTALVAASSQAPPPPPPPPSYYASSDTRQRIDNEQGKILGSVPTLGKPMDQCTPQERDGYLDALQDYRQRQAALAARASRTSNQGLPPRGFVIQPQFGRRQRMGREGLPPF